MKTKRLLTALLVVLIIIIPAACDKIEKSESPYTIMFGDLMGPCWTLSDIRIQCKSNVLNKKLSDKKWFIYVSSKVENYEQIAEKFGFDESQIFMRDDSRLCYHDETEDVRRILSIDSDGEISYSTGIKETYFETKVREADCVELIKEVLKQYGLTEKTFSKECSVGESSVTNPAENETKTIGYTVTVYFMLDGVELHGDPRAYVTFNGNGEAVYMMYNMPDFIESGPAKLISVRQVLNSIRKGEISVMYGLDTDDAPDRITIEDVDICYYSQSFGDIQVAQPMYVFSAIAHFKNEKIPFTICAQAN